jgi:hypothetical protein
MFMDDELKELKDRISQMSDQQLLQIVEVEYKDYRKEAIEFAEAELTKRSMPFQKPGDKLNYSDEDEETDSVISARSDVACGNCGGKMRSASLFAEHELTILFSDSNEERFVQAFVCTACGDVRLVADLQTDVEG